MGIPAGTDSIECALGRYADMVFRIAYHNVKTREDAEDITQEVFIKLISSGKVLRHLNMRRRGLSVLPSTNAVIFYGRGTGAGRRFLTKPPIKKIMYPEWRSLTRL